MGKRGVVGFIVLVALVAAGCGSSDSSSTSSSTSSKSAATESSGFDPKTFEAIEAKGAPPAAFPQLPASPPVAKGKFVVNITCSLAAEGCAEADRGAHAAADALGWKLLTIDTGGDPAKILSAFEQAKNLHADGIMLNSLDPSQVKEPVADARKRGVPVVCMGCGILKSNVDPPEDSVNHEVISPGVLQGQIEGAGLVLGTNGKARILVLSAPEFASIRDREQGAREVFEMCPDCTVAKTIKLTVADLATSLPAKIKAALQADPKINAVWVGFDAGAMVANTAIEQLGKGDEVQVWSNDGLQQNLGVIKAGGPQKGSVTQPLRWKGWAVMDNLNRLFNDEAPVEDDQIPAVLITEDNVDEWSDGKTGSLDYQGAYRKLWGIG